ncbi:Serine proteinase stubble [Halotydeus destructor]|nr:Serine proteinase stubble [Halotydeus destructor]
MWSERVAISIFLSFSLSVCHCQYGGFELPQLRPTSTEPPPPSRENGGLKPFPGYLPDPPRGVVVTKVEPEGPPSYGSGSEDKITIPATRPRVPQVPDYVPEKPLTDSEPAQNYPSQPAPDSGYGVEIPQTYPKPGPEYPSQPAQGSGYGFDKPQIYPKPQSGYQDQPAPGPDYSAGGKQEYPEEYEAKPLEKPQEPYGPGSEGRPQLIPVDSSYGNPAPVPSGPSPDLPLDGYAPPPSRPVDSYQPEPVVPPPGDYTPVKPVEQYIPVAPSGGYDTPIVRVPQTADPAYSEQPSKPVDSYKPEPVASKPVDGYAPVNPIKPVDGYAPINPVKPVNPYVPELPSGSYGGPKRQVPSQLPRRPETGPPEQLPGSGYGQPPIVPQGDKPYETKPVNPHVPDYSNSYADDEVGPDGCICVPFYQCKDGNIVDDGAGIIDPRSKRPPSQQIPLESSYAPPHCGQFHVCCSDPEQVTVKPYEPRCGIRNPSGLNRRILSPHGKEESDFGEWPWQAAVLKHDKLQGQNLFQCGGTLIDDQHVLTVAHCVASAASPYSQNKLKVRLGEWDTQTDKEFNPHEDYDVIYIAIHPEFRNQSLWNDVAVLTLDRKVNFKPHIDRVCLPDPSEVFDGQTCVTTGWGKNAYKGGSYSNILKEATLPVVPRGECQYNLRRTRLGRRFRLHSSFMCAGGQEGKDSCKGDGGGPLVCYRKDGTYTLAGLVAWGIDCGQPNVPGVYVKVQEFLPWIGQQTAVDPSSYKPAYLEPPKVQPIPVQPSGGY